MKNIGLRYSFNFCVVVLTIGLTNCKKNEAVDLPTPKACFTVKMLPPFSTVLQEGTTTLTDSDFYFKNCSTADNGITYLWTFGDGTTSDLQSPQHKYSKRGTYPVRLIVYRNNKPYDSAYQDVSVVLGQQNISIREGSNTTPVDIVQTSNNEFDLLGYTNLYFLMRLDSAMKPKSVKYFPKGNRFSAIQKAENGNYIMTGSTLVNTDRLSAVLGPLNELIKISPEGEVLWSKTLFTDDIYTDVHMTPDNGFVITGQRVVERNGSYTGYKIVVIKTDGMGQVQWQKLFDADNSMETSFNAVVDEQGVVVAGVKRGDPVKCGNCDSMSVIRLNYSGNIAWKNAVLWPNTQTLWNTRIAKLSNDGFAVINEYQGNLFFFSSSGVFLNRVMVQNQTSVIEGAPDGKLMALITEYGGSGLNFSIKKFTLIGQGAMEKKYRWQVVINVLFKIRTYSNSSPTKRRHY